MLIAGQTRQRDKLCLRAVKMVSILFLWKKLQNTWLASLLDTGNPGSAPVYKTFCKRGKLCFKNFN